MLEVSPSLNRFASGRRWKMETAAAVPRKVEVVVVEIRSFSSVYYREARSSGAMIG